MRYFAYGSNMLVARLERRVGPVQLLGPADIAKRALRFHKRGADGSGKCDIPLTADESDVVPGVLFDLPEEGLEELDRFEWGYRRSEVTVRSRGAPVRAITYLGTTHNLDPGARPFDWYLDLVRAGAAEHGLSERFRRWLDPIAGCSDPDPARPARLEALKLVREFYSSSGR